MLDQFYAKDDKGDKGETSNSKANKQKNKLSFCTQMRLFLFYENPIMFFFIKIAKVEWCKRKNDEKTGKLKKKMEKLQNDRLDLKKILNKIDRFEKFVIEFSGGKKPPDNETQNFDPSRERRKKDPDKYQARAVQEMMVSKNLNELTISEHKIKINKPEVMKITDSQMKKSRSRKAIIR